MIIYKHASALEKIYALKCFILHGIYRLQSKYPNSETNGSILLKDYSIVIVS